MIVGIAIVLFVVSVIWMPVPVARAAGIVVFLTFSFWWTGVAFLAIAVFSVLYKILDLMVILEGSLFRKLTLHFPNQGSGTS